MNSETQSLKDDALVMVHLRNEFYRKKFRFLLAVYALSLIGVIILLSILIYLVKNPTQPIYFPADRVGRLIHETAVTQPNMSIQDMANWVQEAVESAYSYDYVNYRAQLQSAQKYFTDWGWGQYMIGLQRTNNLLALTKNKYVVTAKVVSTPQLLTQGVLGGVLAWKFQMPVLVTYQYPPFDSKSSFANALTVTVIVQRENILESYQGLGVAQIIARIVINQPTTNTIQNTPSS